VCRIHRLTVKKFRNYGQTCVCIRKLVRHTGPIFRKPIVAQILFVKKRNKKFRANSRKYLLLVVGHGMTYLVSTYGAICNFTNSAWKCHYVTSHSHQLQETNLTRQRIRIVSLPRKRFLSIQRSN
jgi:hypothetical protein